MEFIALYCIASAFFGLAVVAPVWLLLSIFTPKALLDRYFKEPHFSLTETIMLRGFPGFWIRTSIFAWTILFPAKSQGRQMKNIREIAPLWYKLSVCCALFSGLIVLFNLTIILPFVALL
jgi:hypothetical protein